MGIEIQIAKGLAKGTVDSIKGKVTSWATGWFLSGVLGLGGDNQSEILAKLDQISNQLKQVIAAVGKVQDTLNSFINLFNATDDFNRLRQALDPYLTAVESDYDLLPTLTTADQATAGSIRDKALFYREAQHTLIAVMGGTYSGSPGADLITTFGAMLAARINGPAKNTSDPAPLVASYEALERYFHAMLNVEVKAAALAVNAHVARHEQNLAHDAATQLLDAIPGQCVRFLAAAEALAVAYHSDTTLVDMLADTEGNDPIRRAHAYVNGYREEATARVWAWSGAGAAHQLEPLPSLPSQLILQAGASIAAGVAATATYTTGPDRWSMARFEFAASSLGNDTAFTYEPSVFNAHTKDWSGAPALNTSRTLLLRPGRTAALVGFTSLSFKGGALAIPDSLNSIGRSDHSIELWFYPLSAGTLVSSDTSWDSERGRDIGWQLSVIPGANTYYQIRYLSTVYDGDPYSVDLYAPCNGQWNHVAVTLQGSLVSLYVNGALTNTGRIQPRYPVTALGARFWPRAGGGESPAHYDGQWSGLMNEVRLWSRALTQTEIQANMHAFVKPAADVAIFGLDRGKLVDRSASRWLAQDGPVEFAQFPDNGWM